MNDPEEAAVKASKASGELVLGYAAAIILGVRPSRGDAIKSASGIFVELHNRFFFFTAQHVLDDYTRLREDNVDLLAHLGQTQFNPHERLAYRDDDADLAFLQVSEQEAADLGRWIYRPTDWPPTPPEVGDLVDITGYPGVIRERQGKKQIHFRGFRTQSEVASINERQFSCQFDREQWVELGEPGGRDERNLGGVSGGPVFIFDRMVPRLVGLVSVCLGAVTACSFSSAPRIAPEAMPEGVQIHRTVRLYLTQDFAAHTYRTSQDARKLTYEFGPGAEDALRQLFQRSFDSVDVVRVSSETAFNASLRGDDAWGRFDFVAIARFMDENSYLVPFTAGIQIGIQVDFVPRSGRSVITIRGEGTGRINLWIGSEVAGAGREALEGAINALRDNLAAKRSDFQR